MQHEVNWIALAEILGPRSHALRPLLQKFTGPEEIFSADEVAIREALPDIGAGHLSSILNKRSQREAERIATWCRRNGVRILTYDSVDYPACLREIDEPPAVLYCRGKLPILENKLAVGVVGARKLDAYGQQVAYKLSFEMAAAGAIIVSGLAAGVDGMASVGALNAGGGTIAVLGCGIDLTYPKEHTRLAAEVAERGTVLTEFAPGTSPNGWNFPMRNRLISALSSAVMVVEAGATSGALITARYAVIQGKTLFAVPGNITSPLSAGSNRLLLDGARPALDAEEILTYFRFLYRDGIDLSVLPEASQYSALTPEALRPFGLRMIEDKRGEEREEPAQEKEPRRKAGRRARREAPVEAVDPTPRSAPDTSALTPRQRELFEMLPDGSFSVDDLVARGVSASEAASTLTIFEIYGLTRSIPGGMFEKR